jgi:hypothetical protein
MTRAPIKPATKKAASTKTGWQQHYKKSPAIMRTSPDGIVHHSKANMTRWVQLKNYERAGAISDLQREVAYPLLRQDGTPYMGANGRALRYTLDFEYTVIATGARIYEEVKGFMKRDEKLRITLFEDIYKCKVTVVKQQWGKLLAPIIPFPNKF